MKSFSQLTRPYYSYNNGHKTVEHETKHYLICIIANCYHAQLNQPEIEIRTLPNNTDNQIINVEKIQQVHNLLSTKENPNIVYTIIF
jgi:hypothetical protein